MERKPVDQKPPLTLDLIILTAVAVEAVVALIAAISQLISTDSALGVTGLAAIVTVAAIHTSLASRAIAVLIGLCMLAYGGWLDFEGWRFLPPLGSLGGSP